MIFTSYFAKTKKFPDNFIPVSISQWPPKGYEGLQCKELAPTKEILTSYKESDKPEHIKEERYITSYKQDVLAGVNFKSLLKDLEKELSEDMLDNMDTENIWESHTLHLVLTCFEKSESFCHRNIVAAAMKEQGIYCREVEDVDLVRMGFNLGFEIGKEI